MENEQRLEIIKKVDTGAILNEYGIFFKIDDIKVIYDTKEKEFFVRVNWKKVRNITGL